jgi:hypothetical protein
MKEFNILIKLEDLKIKISYVSSGLGNNFGDEIELNENLKKYPEIHDAILEHELSHTNKAFTLKDLKLDLCESKINSFDIIKFMIKYPKSFSQLFPFYYSKKHGFVYDLNLILIYSVTFCLSLIVILTALRF